MAEEIIGKLEGQVDEIMSLYDLAEQAYSYENMKGDRKLNEDERRRQLISQQTYGSNVQRMLANTLPYSLFAMYVFSRRGAAHMFDFSRLQQCYWRTFGWYMIGQTYGQVVNIVRLKQEQEFNQHLHMRVAENEDTHSVLRAMKFHLTTRTMSIWDQDPR